MNGQMKVCYMGSYLDSTAPLICSELLYFHVGFFFLKSSDKHIQWVSITLHLYNYYQQVKETKNISDYGSGCSIFR